MNARIDGPKTPPAASSPPEGRPAGLGRPGARPASLEQRRKAGIKAIKCAQRQLGLDDATYRTMLQAQTGKRSATELSVPEQGRVLDYLRRQGAANPRRAAYDGGRKRATPAPERAALMRKVHALLAELHRVTGEPHSLNYADAICKRNGWAERVDFCAPHDLHSLVGALARTLRAKAAHPSPAHAH
jgi:hypothetical protein